MRERSLGTTSERGLARLGALARDASPRDVPEAWRDRVLDAVERDGTLVARPRARASHAAPRRALPLRMLPLAAAVLLAAVAVRGARLQRTPSTLTYALDSHPGGSRDVRAGPDGAVARFSDGTVIGFAPGARGHVVAVTAHGAEVSVDEGKAHFRVMHLPAAEWTVEAGPYAIAVTGTEFDVTWEGGKLDVVMQTGSVSIQGPLTSHAVALRGGQHLAADVARGELTIGDTATAAIASSGPPAATDTAPRPLTPADLPSATPDPAPIHGVKPAHGTAATASAPPAPPPTSAGPSFRERVAKGEFDAVIAEAEGRGLDRVIDAGSLADVAALADAARYADKPDLARRALIAVRSRFVGSAEARSAAFLLGRMEESRSPSAAVDWYDTYLEESPEGSLAPEALGRKMVALRASPDLAAARQVAAEYLTRYPRGSFAKAARDILASP